MHSREKKIYKVTLAGSAVNAVLIALKFLSLIHISEPTRPY